MSTSSGHTLPLHEKASGLKIDIDDLKAMRRLVLPALTCIWLITPVFAEPPASAEKKDFATVKQRRLAKIDAMRACVAKSSSFDEMKACKPERKKKEAD